MVDSSQLLYIDLYSRPFDYNAFDNLPLSQAIPNTFSGKLPKKLVTHSFTLVDSDQMLSSNFKALFTKLDKALKSLEAKERVLVMVDNINIIINGCYSGNELDFVEIMNDLTNLTDKEVSVAVGINRDLVTEEQWPFYRDMKHSSFQTVFEVNRNLSGYSRDVHG